MIQPTSFTFRKKKSQTFCVCVHVCDLALYMVTNYSGPKYFNSVKYLNSVKKLSFI